MTLTRELAELNPIVYDSEEHTVCFFCGIGNPWTFDVFLHGRDCLWIRARSNWYMSLPVGHLLQTWTDKEAWDYYHFLYNLTQLAVPKVRGHLSKILRDVVQKRIEEQLNQESLLLKKLQEPIYGQ